MQANLANSTSTRIALIYTYASQLDYSNRIVLLESTSTGGEINEALSTTSGASWSIWGLVVIVILSSLLLLIILLGLILLILYVFYRRRHQSPDRPSGPSTGPFTTRSSLGRTDFTIPVDQTTSDVSEIQNRSRLGGIFVNRYTESFLANDYYHGGHFEGPSSALQDPSCINVNRYAESFQAPDDYYVGPLGGGSGNLPPAALVLTHEYDDIGIDTEHQPEPTPLPVEQPHIANITIAAVEGTAATQNTGNSAHGSTATDRADRDLEDDDSSPSHRDSLNRQPDTSSC